MSQLLPLSEVMHGSFIYFSIQNTDAAGLLILLCYQELHGIGYGLIYLKSSPEHIRILIVS